MPKYTVYGTYTIGLSMVVEADSEEHALEVACEEFEGLRNYAGMGGTDKLVGTDQEEVSLDAEGDADFTTVDHYED